MRLGVPFHHSRLSEPGTWHFSETPEGHVVTICCPQCGTLGVLEDHFISPEGDVVPSIICPNDECKYHAFIYLTGWGHEDYGTATRLPIA